MSTQESEGVFSENEISNMLGELDVGNLGGQKQLEQILLEDEENDSQDIQAIRTELDTATREHQGSNNLSPINFGKSSIDDTSRQQGYLNGSMNPYMHSNENIRRGFGGQYLYNLHKIQEGIYQSQEGMEVGSYHVRSCSDSASNSTVGVQRLMSPEFPQTNVPAYLTSQAHRRTQSDQLPLPGDGFPYREAVRTWQPEGVSYIEAEHRLQMERSDPYIDANGTHEAMGHMVQEIPKLHRRVQSCDGSLYQNYRNWMIPTIQRHQGLICGELPICCNDVKMTTLQYANLVGCEQAMLDTSKKSSVRMRDKQLSPKNLKRVIANRKSAKKSRDRKEKYRKDMEDEKEVLQDALQFIDQLIEEEYQKLENEKQRNQELRQAVQDFLFLQKTQQVR
eukprot:TRINITY_DN22863_c0_g1_i4.p1 TRINITY_DN22863_c0_g1~~TRINITY_DN22863_c0_g1_i4.p1  ORF type:complete len:393 (-),score=45.23 TRINITY_DN22863_c0_g1_i4:508-1686(-)